MARSVSLGPAKYCWAAAGICVRSYSVTSWPRASNAPARFKPTKPVPPKIMTLITMGLRSQQARAKISLGIHVRHQTSGWLRRLASRARQEAAGACFDRTFAVRDDDAPAR